jgi:hypothetical protein
MSFTTFRLCQTSEYWRSHFRKHPKRNVPPARKPPRRREPCFFLGESLRLPNGRAVTVTRDYRT